MSYIECFKYQARSMILVEAFVHFSFHLYAICAEDCCPFTKVTFR
jgi:hypothetical protein